MTSRDFCFWLQGYLELSDGKPFTPDQMLKMRQHLHLVFKHEIDPSMPGQHLDDIHGNKPGEPIMRC